MPCRAQQNMKMRYRLMAFYKLVEIVIAGLWILQFAQWI